MKDPEDVLNDVAARLRRTWADTVVGAPWASEFRLGTSDLTGRRLAESWPDVHRYALVWEAWMETAGDGVRLGRRAVTVHRTHQAVPAALLVDSADTAARLLGEEWVDRLARGRARHAVLAAQFPEREDAAALLRSVDAYSDVDFDLLCRTATWFRGPHPSGLTARQVPVEGIGTKWLGHHEAVVRRLAGTDSLGLERGRPPRVHLTYLDPAHLGAGGRRHDVATVGDIDAVAYRPRVVLISENRDTAQLFPPVAGGIAIEGEGRGAATVAALPWVCEAAIIWYWGDMDADDLEILNGFRAAGLPARSLFMDVPSYERWERYGVDHNHRRGPIGPRAPRDVWHLEPAELELYLALCSLEWSRHRRIEQERIPLAAALEVIQSVSA